MFYRSWAAAACALLGASLLLVGNGCRDDQDEYVPPGLDGSVNVDGSGPSPDGPGPDVPITPGYETSVPNPDQGPPPQDDLGIPPDKGTPVLPDAPVPKKDSYVPPQDSYVPQPDTWTPPPPPPPPGAVKAAAVQYGPGLFPFGLDAYGKTCTDDNCGLAYFVTQAAKAGATLVVTPEAALDQSNGSTTSYYPAPLPKIGDKPALWSSYANTKVIIQMAKLADQLNITLVFNLITYAEVAGVDELYNTNIAVDKGGSVIGVHKKWHLYSGETKSFTAGTSCCDSFPTPPGKAGMVICADIQCVFKIALNKSPSSCKSSSETLLKAYKAAGFYITTFSSYWMATGSTSPWWKPIDAWSLFAKWSGTYMIAANTIGGSSLQYRGGGVFDPNGNMLAFYDQKQPGHAIATIPKQGSPPPPPPDVVVTEFMANPAAVSDSSGEWFEVYNAGSSAIDLNGWTIKDATGSHTIKSSVPVGPGKYVVLGNNDNTGSNGGVPVAYDYGSMSLGNSGDTIQLYDLSGKLMDEVVYTSSWVNSGASTSLKSVTADNSVSSNWCVETTAWSGSDGDKGTPGAAAKCK